MTTPNDPNWHWDGQRWLYWNGTAWVEPPSAPPPAAADAPTTPASPAGPADAATTEPLAVPPPDLPSANPVDPAPPKRRSKAPWIIAGAVGAVIVVIIAVGVAASGSGTRAQDLGSGASTTPSLPSTNLFPSEPSLPSDTPTPTPTATSPAGTASQEQALGAAHDYLGFQAFSSAALIAQLSAPVSSGGSGFSKADATWAVNHLSVDWNEQAVRAGKSYLELQHFSCSGLIDQLDSKDGSQFTKPQATYAAKNLGLC